MQLIAGALKQRPLLLMLTLQRVLLLLVLLVEQLQLTDLSIKIINDGVRHVDV